MTTLECIADARRKLSHNDESRERQIDEALDCAHHLRPPDDPRVIAEYHVALGREVLKDPQARSFEIHSKVMKAHPGWWSETYDPNEPVFPRYFHN